MSSAVYGAAILSLSLVSLVHLFGTDKVRSRSPPGPAPLPVIGNIHQLASGRIRDTFVHWEQTYGALKPFRASQHE